MTLLSLSPADFKRILTVLVDRRILVSQCCFEYGTGCELHLSNQTLQCPVVTIRCYSWSAGSWQVFHIVGFRVKDIPVVCMPIVCHLCASDIRIRTMLMNIFV
jgi:hypothetical protein